MTFFTTECRITLKYRPMNSLFSVSHVPSANRRHNDNRAAAFQFGKGCFVELMEMQYEGLSIQDHNFIQHAKTALELRSYFDLRKTWNTVPCKGFLHLDILRPQVKLSHIPLAPTDSNGFLEDDQACHALRFEGDVLHRHNGAVVSDLWHHGRMNTCLSEALIFAVGASLQSDMGLKLVEQLSTLPNSYNSIAELNVILRFSFGQMPFRLRPFFPVTSWASLLACRAGIFICCCSVTSFEAAAGWTAPSMHAVTFDAWRGLLYVGGGKSTEQWLSGFILVEESDRTDPSNLITHLAGYLHVGHLHGAHRLFVNKKRARHTPFNTPALLGGLR